MGKSENRSYAKDVNLEYYLRKSPGRADYWRKMAAPRFRMRTFLRLLAESRPASLVDMGCGSGELLGEIRRNFPQMRLCGLDLSSSLIEGNRRSYPSIEWHALDLDCTQDFQSELVHVFDAVIASEIIEHLDNPLAFLKNARELARPGNGMLFLSTQSGAIHETERRVGHKRHYSAAEMRVSLVDAGWNPVRIWNAGFPFHDLSKWFANINPDSTMKKYSEQAYGVGQNLVCAMLRLAFRFNSGKRGAQLFAVASA